MAPHRRHRIGASRRRRREDEGEDEGSIDGALEDDSLSEGSVLSHQDDDDADGEGSDASEDDASDSPQADKSNGQVNGRVHEAEEAPPEGRSASPGKRLFASTMSDTEAMMNGLKLSDGASEVAEIHFDDMKEEPDDQAGRTPSAPPPIESKRETFAERKLREHEEYIKERDENPAFVPTRGGFFLHDKRSTEPDTNGYKPSTKPKSRPYGLIVDGNVGRRPPKTDAASEGPWTHDLHETVARDEPPASNSPAAASTPAMPNSSKPVPTAPRSTPPNRSFSSTVLIGNVPVVVFLPGMKNPIPYSAVPKRQHTRLPQHRPPLRRDKPVRISLPGQPPRYIFPSTERSFIFIPRALRPNQQAFRGRGRGGFYGSRRPSLYAPGAYSPSVPMSRRSSVGRASREGVNSPAASVLSRQTMVPTENGKPVVRLPPPARPPGGPQTTNAGSNAAPASAPPPASYPQPQNPNYRESRPAPIPMHQPRPQKTVSVADIESPASLPFNPPQPQQEQPFHQQAPVPVNGSVYGPDASAFPPHARHASHPSQASGTPLSHIPERAIHAQPFQPYGFQQPHGFYPAAAYPPGTVFYPVSGAEYPPYSAPVAPGAAAPPFIPPGQQVPYVMPVPPATAEQPAQPGTVAHESGGTVYYYDTTQMYPAPSFPMPAPAAGGVVGMGGMITPPGTTYYYPQPQGGVYYTTQ